MKVVKVAVKVAMKIVDAGSDEGGEGLILRGLWGFAFRQTNGETFAIVELHPQLKIYIYFLFS